MPDIVKFPFKLIASSVGEGPPLCKSKVPAVRVKFPLIVIAPANIVPEIRIYKTLLPVWMMVKFPCMVVVPAAAINATVLVIAEGLKVKLPKVCPTKLFKTVAAVNDPVIFKLELDAQVEVVVPRGNVGDDVA